MNLDWVKTLSFFIVLLLVQVLVFNHIHLFGYATPLLYVYFVLPARRGFPKWALLLWAFLLGLSVDIFSNTPGLAAASMTLVALIQPYLLELFVPRDSPDDLKPSFRSLGAAKYMFYTFILMFVYSVVFFSLEIFSFFNWLQWLASAGGSMLLTLVLVWVIENLVKRE